MEPEVGIEPTTYSLRVNCSTPELLRQKTFMIIEYFQFNYQFIFQKAVIVSLIMIIFDEEI